MKGTQQKSCTTQYPFVDRIAYFDYADIWSIGLFLHTQKWRVAHAPEMKRTFFRHRLQEKPLFNDIGMHYGTCVTHAPWCMAGSLTSGGRQKVPGACATRDLHAWQEAHGRYVCDHTIAPAYWNDECNMDMRITAVAALWPSWRLSSSWNKVIYHS